MTRFLLIPLLVLPAFGQWADFSAQTASSNLYNAMNGKPSFQTGSGAPTSLNCTAGKDLYTDTVGNYYICITTGTPGTWLHLANAGSSAPPSGSAGGSLAGTYPNPTLAAQANATFLSNVSGGSAAPSANSLPATANALIKTTNANGALAASSVTDNGTTVSTTEPLAAPSFSTNGSGAGVDGFGGGTQSLTGFTNQVGWIGPATTPSGNHFFTIPLVGAAANQFMLYGAESSNISTPTLTTFSFANTTDAIASAHVMGTTSGKAPVAATAADLSAINYAAGGGSANAQTATYSPAIAALTNGLSVCWLPTAANTTTTPNFAPNGLTAKTIVKVGGAALVASDLTTTAIACAQYDGTNWELQNPQTTAAAGYSTIDSNGSAVTQRSTVNFISGTNATVTCVDNGGSTRTDCTIAATAGSSAPVFPANAQTATYQLLAADFSNFKTIVVASGTFTITGVASGSQPANGQGVWIVNYGSGTLTLARSGQNINGGTTSITMGPGTQQTPNAVFWESDGTNYLIVPFGPGLVTSVGGQTGAVLTPTFTTTTVNSNSGSLPSPQTGTVLQVGNANTTSTRLELDAFAASGFYSVVREDGTAASPTALLSGDQIGGYNSFGYDGTAIVGPQASLRTYANQNWVHSSALGTYVDITTTPNGSTTAAEVIRFENDAGITVPNTVTGGDKGPGTLNTNGLFVNGTATALTIASGTAAMGTGAITSGACASVVTVSASGVATTDAIVYTPNADPTGVTGYAVSASGSLYIWAYPTSGNVNFKVCNNTGGSLTPSALTLNWRVAR